MILMYSAQVLDHFEHPRNTGEVANADAVVQLSNPACGDVLKLTLKVDAGVISKARFLAKGCVPAMACGSVLTEMIQGKTMEAASTFSREELVQIAAEGTLQGLQTQGQFQGGRNAIDHLNQMRTEQGNTRAVVDGLPQKLLIDTRVDNRNVFDWAKYNAALTIGLGSTTGKVDVDALAAALEARLEKTDTKALLDALAARLAA